MNNSVWGINYALRSIALVDTYIDANRTRLKTWRRAGSNASRRKVQFRLERPRPSLNANCCHRMFFTILLFKAPSNCEFFTFASRSTFFARREHLVYTRTVYDLFIYDFLCLWFFYVSYELTLHVCPLQCTGYPVAPVSLSVSM